MYLGLTDSYLHFLLPYRFETKSHATPLFITHFYLWVAAKDTVCCDWVAALFYSAKKNIWELNWSCKAAVSTQILHNLYHLRKNTPPFMKFILNAGSLEYL